jgi:pimeloyl-ACP methyl ester carboxylesterase
MVGKYGPHNPDETFVTHAFAEHLFDTGEVQINYATAGAAQNPALLLIPGQTESWWGYEAAMEILKADFEVFAVDLRGQGRSSRTPGRYTLDNFGADLVRFIDKRIGRPSIVSGLSSGGLISAWLSAYGEPGAILGAHYEDPPFFHAEVDTTVGQSLRQGIGGNFALMSKYLGDQWSVGDWDGMAAAAPTELPKHLVGLRLYGAAPPQNLKEYDPEWARAFWTGAVSASCNHARMLAVVKTPVLYTHHFRTIHEETGCLLGAASDLQAATACDLVKSTGQALTYLSFPAMGHSMHGQDPALFAKTLTDWAKALS